MSGTELFEESLNQELGKKMNIKNNTSRMTVQILHVWVVEIHVRRKTHCAPMKEFSIFLLSYLV